MECHTSGCHTVHLINWQEGAENTLTNYNASSAVCVSCSVITVEDKTLYLMWCFIYTNRIIFTINSAENIILARIMFCNVFLITCTTVFFPFLSDDSYCRFPNQIDLFVHCEITRTTIMTGMRKVNQFVATGGQNRKLKITHKTEHQKSNMQQRGKFTLAPAFVLYLERVCPRLKG